ncbi:MAG: siroheme decarboxylase subunit beta [Sulfuriferula sp.]
MSTPAPLDEIDRRIVLATQDGLPLVPRPYHAIAERLDLAPEVVMTRLRCMLARGIVRRIGVVPNHYALGFTSNGMTVWDVNDTQISAVGRLVGKLEFVSHCYHRPRQLPYWPYNLFAMVHGHSRGEVEGKTRQIAELIAGAAGSHRILFSSRILKKIGLRFGV